MPGANTILPISKILLADLLLYFLESDGVDGKRADPAKIAALLRAVPEQDLSTVTDIYMSFVYGRWTERELNTNPPLSVYRSAFP